MPGGVIPCVAGSRSSDRSAQESRSSEISKRRSSVARLTLWRPVSINFIVESESFARLASFSLDHDSRLRRSRNSSPNATHAGLTADIPENPAASARASDKARESSSVAP